MGRHYDRDYYRERIEKIAQLMPESAIGADVMVGFPGETETHFINTFDLLDQLPMTYLHVFPFSLRDGTPAEKLTDHQNNATKKERTRRLIKLGQQKRLQFHTNFIGQTLSTLVEDRRDASSGLQVGLTNNYIKVLFPGSIPANELVDVHITHAREDLVFGELATEKP